MPPCARAGLRRAEVRLPRRALPVPALGRAQRAEGPAPRAPRRSAPAVAPDVADRTPPGMHAAVAAPAADRRRSSRGWSSSARPGTLAGHGVRPRRGRGPGPRRPGRDPPRGPVRLLAPRAARAPGRRSSCSRTSARPTAPTSTRSCSRGPQPLHPGDRVRIGDSEFTYADRLMLRVAEHFDAHRHRAASAGPTRTRYFARAPLFVVADGMGGAQAGEVASQHRGRGLRATGLPDGGGPREERLRRAGRARPTRASTSSRAADDERAGMGTTLTAAYVGEDERRDRPRRRLPRLPAARRRARAPDRRPLARRASSCARASSRRRRPTSTRSARSSRARSGPRPTSRSTRTRAPARDGDVFLLCCDGLTSMVPEARGRARSSREAPIARRAPAAR